MAEKPQALKILEETYKKCAKRNDFVGALDALEEIDRHGWAGAEHLTALGHALLRNRRRQDAKEVWVRATEMDPDYAGARQALDQYFPGWQRRLHQERKRRQQREIVETPGAAEAPPPGTTARADQTPPPPPSGSRPREDAAGSLQVDTVAPKDRDPARVREQLSRAADDAARRAATQSGAAQPEASGAGRSNAGESTTARRAAGGEPDPGIATVNWHYVLEDVAEFQGQRR